jgi:hypothetical protein
VKTEATLLSEIAAAPTLREQAALVAELDALRNSKTARVQADRDWDAAGAVVEQTLTPVFAHSLHTASTDWLSESEIPAVDANHVHAEASLWFGKTSSMVKADAEEFGEQAKGVARRLASQYGEQAPEAERLFMDYVAFLHRREAASGLDQIQQTIDPNNQPKTTKLPTEAFDTFQDAIDPMNQGVDEMQSSDNAPLLNEILQEGGGSGSPEWNQGHSTAPQPTQNPMGGSSMQVGASLVDVPSPGIGYLYNLDDFLRAEAAIKTQAGREPSDDLEDHTASAGKAEVPDEHDTDEDEDSFDYGDKKKVARVERIEVVPVPLVAEAASGLDQVQQTIDPNNQPKPTSMPTDVAFPLIPYFASEANTLDAGYDQRKESSLTKEADEWTAGAPVEKPEDNPMLGKTHVGGEKKVDEPTSAMEKATAGLSKSAAAEYNKGARFGATWQPGQPIVRQGSVEFEAGLYAGITANAAAQEAWLAEHEKWGATDKGIAERIEMHAAFTQVLVAEAATTTDLDTMTPGTNPAPNGDTPINGPGTIPPLAGGMDPAAPGGAAPYNGAPPFSSPVAPDPGWVRQGSVDSEIQRQAAFRDTVQANLAAARLVGES